MSVKFNHTAHKEMWTWLSENPEMDKDDWPEWIWNSGGLYTGMEEMCFACLYAVEIKEFSSEKGDGISICPLCPLLFPEPCSRKLSLYRQWDTEESKELRSSLALQIANLPVKDGVETV